MALIDILNAVADELADADAVADVVVIQLTCLSEGWRGDRFDYFMPVSDGRARHLLGLSQSRQPGPRDVHSSGMPQYPSESESESESKFESESESESETPVWSH